MSSRGSRFVIIVGVDFSPMSSRALDEALRIASLRQGELHAVYVQANIPTDHPFSAPMSILEIDIDAAVESLRKLVQARVEAAVAQTSAPAVTRVVAHVRRGSPAREITEIAANLDADLVVVGSHGRHGVERFLLGSVAERVLRLARCPVYVVRTKDHAAELKVPEIEPPCTECVARREATGGAEFWCKRHAEHHLRAHRYSYVQNGMYAPETASYEATPEG